MMLYVAIVAHAICYSDVNGIVELNEIVAIKHDANESDISDRMFEEGVVYEDNYSNFCKLIQMKVNRAWEESNKEPN